LRRAADAAPFTVSTSSQRSMAVDPDDRHHGKSADEFLPKLHRCSAMVRCSCRLVPGLSPRRTGLQWKGQATSCPGRDPLDATCKAHPWLGERAGMHAFSCRAAVEGENVLESFEVSTTHVTCHGRSRPAHATSRRLDPTAANHPSPRCGSTPKHVTYDQVRRIGFVSMAALGIRDGIQVRQV
jgi:hypothetical protein